MNSIYIFIAKQEFQIMKHISLTVAAAAAFAFSGAVSKAAAADIQISVRNTTGTFLSLTNLSCGANVSCSSALNIPPGASRQITGTFSPGASVILIIFEHGSAGNTCRGRLLGLVENREATQIVGDADYDPGFINDPDNVPVCVDVRPAFINNLGNIIWDVEIRNI